MARPHRHMFCPECGRISSVAPWCKRPICVHAWNGLGTEVWDGDDVNYGIPIEQSPNQEWRSPGSDTWAEMVEFEPSLTIPYP